MKKTTMMEDKIHERRKTRDERYGLTDEGR